MKTLRIDSDLEARLQRAASVSGESLSEFIRQAAAQRADTVLTSDEPTDFADVLGAVNGGGGRARQTGSAFADLLVAAKRSS